MPVGSVSTAVPPPVAMALEALASTLQAEQQAASVLLGGAAASGGASNPGLGQIVDLSA